MTIKKKKKKNQFLPDLENKHTNIMKSKLLIIVNSE